MRTIQKVNNFNHGMIVPELVERSDLDLYNKSCAKLINMVPMTFGGVRSRRGTKNITKLQFQTSAQVVGTATSPLGDASAIQSLGSGFASNAIGAERNLFQIVYATPMNVGTFSIFGIKLDYQAPAIELSWQSSGQNAVQLSSISLLSGGIGFNGTYYIPPKGRTTTAATLNMTYDSKGTLTDASIANRGSYQSNDTSKTSVGFTRTAAQARIYNASLYISTNGNTWTKHSTIQITEAAQDFNFNIGTSFKYVKLVLDDTTDNITTRYSLNYVQLESEASPVIPRRVRLCDYVYNNLEKYLIILGGGNLIILKDGILSQVIIAPILSDDILDELKWTYKDDTVIFTQKDIQPQRLLRTPDGWNFGAFALENIPKNAFNGPTTIQKSTSITPSATDGNITITGTGFTADMVGQYVDGGGAYVRITDFVSVTQIRGRTIIPFYNTSAVSSWKLISGYDDVFSDERGWPRTCMFAQQRLFFGGSRDLPNRIWSSRLGDYNNFMNIGSFDNDALDFSLDTNEVITNLAFQRNLHIFTSGYEFTVPEDGFTPNTFRAVQISSNGCWPKINPVVYDASVLFIERKGKSLYNYGYNNDDGGFIPTNLSLFSEYQGLPVDLVMEKNSVMNKGDYLFCLLDSGEMLVQSLNLAHNINAMGLFKTNGEILSVAALVDEIWLAVRRGEDIYIEQLVDNHMDFETDVQIVDGEITNLHAYIRQMVLIVGPDGTKEERFVDENGITNVEYIGDGPAKIGYPFDYELESNPIVISGLSTSIRKCIKKATIVCMETDVINFNGQIKRGQDNYEFFAATPYSRDCRYRITGRYDQCKILSVQCNINYEG